MSGFLKFSKNSRFGKHSFSVNSFISKVFFPSTSCIFVFTIATIFARDSRQQYSFMQKCNSTLNTLSSIANQTASLPVAIAITLRGFNDLGPSVTPIFLSMVHFLYRFSTFFEKNEKNLSSRSFNFLQNAPSNSIHMTSSLSCSTVLNASLRVKICENDGNI